MKIKKYLIKSIPVVFIVIGLMVTSLLTFGNTPAYIEQDKNENNYDINEQINSLNYDIENTNGGFAEIKLSDGTIKTIPVLTEEELIELYKEKGNDLGNEEINSKIEELIQTKDAQDDSSISFENLMKLYGEGYGLEDLGLAQNYAKIYSLDPMQLLTLKGKPEYTTMDGNITQTNKTWDEVLKEFNIDFKTPSEELGIKEEILDEYRHQGMSEEEIQNAVVMSFNYNKDLNEVIQDINDLKSTLSTGEYTYENKINSLQISDKTQKLEEKSIQIENELIPFQVIDMLETQYKNEQSNIVPDKAEIELKIKKLLMKNHGITEEDINLANLYGIYNIMEIADLKDKSIELGLGFEETIKLEKIQQVTEFVYESIYEVIDETEQVVEITNTDNADQKEME